MKSISLFNHKGGVSKTTTTFNLGWSLANLGHKVMMVDMDSQCNLTGLVLGYNSILEDSMGDFYTNQSNLTLKPVVDYLIEGKDPALFLSNQDGSLTNTLNPNLFLLPGHLDVSDLDSQISVSLKIAYGIPATKKIPGNLPEILKLIAEKNEIDYMLFDLSPNVGGLNEVILMSSDYFIVPTSPDFFCWQAVDSLSKNISKWQSEISRFKTEIDFNNANYPIKNSPKFLGIIQQRYRPRSGKTAKSFDGWITRIHDAVNSQLVPTLESLNCCIPKEKIDEVLEGSDLEAFDLAYIADFNSLIAISQNNATPVFSLTDDQIKDSGQFGHALNTMKGSRDSFLVTFENLALKVQKLTS
ncbi:ParA family protein [Acinetobacter chinensis]|uniref:ParA family protein n=1 Tax=Acinetobacter chinensis TaxID=2004650 RepID=UPI0029345F85|nr:AAA family ATPase [Acinetobacter chinensis]WOE40073.1 AAA family ATPase [Acinetobacter chinensis]